MQGRLGQRRGLGQRRCRRDDDGLEAPTASRSGSAGRGVGGQPADAVVVDGVLVLELAVLAVVELVRGLLVLVLELVVVLVLVVLLVEQAVLDVLDVVLVPGGRAGQLAGRLRPVDAHDRRPGRDGGDRLAALGSRLERLLDLAQRRRQHLDEPDALAHVPVEALAAAEAVLQGGGRVDAVGHAQEAEGGGDRLARLAEDEARAEQVLQLADREVVGVLAGEPDGAVVLPAVADALDEQVLAVRRGEQRPGLVVEGGGEAPRVVEDDATADGGHEVEQGLAEHLLGQHHPHAVLALQRLAVGQRQVGRPEDDEVGVERHRPPGAERELTGRRPAVVAQLAGQAPGGGVRVAGVGAHPLELVQHVAQARAGRAGDVVDGLGQGGALLALGRAARQQRQEARA